MKTLMTVMGFAVAFSFSHASNRPFCNATVNLYEKGPITVGTLQDTPKYVEEGVTFLPVFRLVSNGETSIAWSIQNTEQKEITVWLEGPFRSEKELQNTPLGDGSIYHIYRTELDGHLDFISELKDPGIYRVIFGRMSWFQGESAPGADERFVFRTRCIRGCEIF